MTAKEILFSIAIAELRFSQKVFDQDQDTLSKIVEKLKSKPSSTSFSADIILRLAKVLRELGKALNFNKKDGDTLFEQAQTVLDIGLERHNDLSLRNEQGNLYFDRGDYDNAFKSFLKVIDGTPAADEADRIHAFENACASIRKQGVGLLDQNDVGRFRQAKEILTRGLKQYTDNSKLLIAEGQLYYDSKQFDRALESFKKVIDKKDSPPNTDSIYAYENAGAALGELRRFNEADEMFQQALAAADGKPSANLLIERGWLEFYQEMYDLAFEDFTAAHRLAAGMVNGEDLHHAMFGQIASLQAADALGSAVDKNRAKDLIDQWQQQQFSQNQLTAVLADCDLVHTDLNLYRAALLNDDLRLETEPDDRDALLAKIDALKWLRRFKDAKDLCRQALKARPAKIDFWREMGNIYYQEKKFRKSHEYYSGEAARIQTKAAPNDASFQEDEEAVEWTIITLRKVRLLRDAEIRVNKALTDIGERASFLCEKGFIYFTERKFDEAIALFDRAVKVNEYYAFAHQWRAASYRKKLKFDIAEEQIVKALTIIPANSGLWEERAWIAFDQNKLTQADEYFARAIKLDPWLINRNFSRVEVLTRLNRSDDARRILLNLKAEFPEDIQVAEQLGWFYLRRGEVDHADTEFQFIEEKDPESALGINGRGGYYLEQGEYALAAKAFCKAIKKIDYEPQYHVNLAWALLRQVKQPGEIPESQLSRRQQLLDDTKAHCRAALDWDEFDAKAHICLGVMAFKADRFSDAEGYFRRSIELSPTEGGHVELGALCVQMGRYPEAEKELTEAIKINGNDARAHIELANLMLLQDNLKEAVRECRTAATVEPNNDEAHRALGIALMRAGQEEEAEKVLRKALSVVPVSKRWQLHLVLSQILIRLGDNKNRDIQDVKKKNIDLYGEALNHVYEALRTHPAPSADVFFHAGIAHFKLDDYKASRQSFDDCLKADRNRFEAERYGKVVQAKIEHEKKILRVNTLGSGFLALLSAVMLVLLWAAYVSGLKRTVPNVEAESAEAKVKNAIKLAEAVRPAETNAETSTKEKEAAEQEATDAAARIKAAAPAQQAALSELAKAKAADAQKAAQAAKDAEMAKNEAVSRADAAVKAAASPQQEVIVDRPMLTVYTPMLLGLFVIALLLPNISKLKLFGGIEAEISEVKTEISSGPKGDVGFGSSLPIISPGPR